MIINKEFAEAEARAREYALAEIAAHREMEEEEQGDSKTNPADQLDTMFTSSASSNTSLALVNVNPFIKLKTGKIQALCELLRVAAERLSSVKTFLYTEETLKLRMRISVVRIATFRKDGRIRKNCETSSVGYSYKMINQRI